MTRIETPDQAMRLPIGSSIKTADGKLGEIYSEFFYRGATSIVVDGVSEPVDDAFNDHPEWFPITRLAPLIDPNDRALVNKAAESIDALLKSGVSIDGAGRYRVIDELLCMIRLHQEDAQ